MRDCKEFRIPIEWMLDNGIIGKVHHTASFFMYVNTVASVRNNDSLISFVIMFSKMCF